VSILAELICHLDLVRIARFR